MRKKRSANEVFGSQDGLHEGLNPLSHFPSNESLHKTVLISFLQITIIMLVSFAVYYNAISGGFVYDDMSQVVENPWIKDVSSMPSMFSKSAWGFMGKKVASNYYRPLMHFVYMLNYQLFGLKSWGFHLVNIMFHCGVSALVFLIIRRFFNINSASKSFAHLSPPFIAALLFAAHPIHTEAVAWISGLPDVAFTFFYLLSFYLYVNSKSMFEKSYMSSLLCFAVAAFFKEPALTLPVILAAHDYIFHEKLTRLHDYLKKYIPYLIIATGYIVLRVNALGGFAAVKRHAGLSAFQYVINVFPLFIKYLEKLLVPINLNVFYVFHPISSLSELKGALALTASVIFAALFPVFFKKNRIALLGLLFVSVPLLPALYIPALGENTFTERYLYLPSVGYILLLAVFLSWARQKLPRIAGIITIAYIVIFGLYSVGTLLRNNVWQNNYRLWTDTVRKSPDSGMAHNNLGAAYASQGKLDMAIAEYQTALRLNPVHVRAHNNLGTAYASQGKLDMAIAEYKTALRLNPDSAEAYYNLGVAYSSLGQWDKAIAEYQTALRLNPDSAETYYNLGVAYSSLGQWDKAITEYQTALRLNPHDNAVRSALNDIILRKH